MVYYFTARLSANVGPTTILVVLLFSSIVVGSATGILSWRQRPKPGSVPLTGLLVGQSWWSTAILFRLQSSTLETKLFWNNLAWIGVISIPLAWVFFVLDYAGYYQSSRKKIFGVLALIPIGTILLVILWPYQELLIVEQATTGLNGVLRIDYGGVWYPIAAAYTYLMGIGGFILLFGLIRSQLVAFRKQAIAVLIGMALPLIANLLYLMNILPHVGIDPTPIAFSITGVTLLFAIKRFKLLHTSPAPNRQARNLVYNRLQEGVIVVDDENHIVDINEQARQYLEVDRPAVLGDDANRFVPHFEKIPEDGEHNEIIEIGDGATKRNFRVGSIPIRRNQDRLIGRVISLNDVTEFVRQQQRLKVLNRLFRHNIRTGTNVILGHADSIETEEGETIKNEARQIEKLGEKSRRAIEIFDRAHSETEPQNLNTMVEGAIEKSRTVNPNAIFAFENPEKPISVPAIIQPAIENAIENAVVHVEREIPEIEVSVTETENFAKLTIADNGPGISDYQLSVLESETETDLQHGSGLGLWIIKWGIELAGGTIQFETNGVGGTTVSLEVPKLEAEVDE